MAAAAIDRMNYCSARLPIAMTFDIVVEENKKQPLSVHCRSY